MVLLFTLKGGRQVRGRRSKKSAKKPASVPAPTTDDAASAAPAEGNGEGEEEEGEEDAAKDDDEDNGDKAAAVADSDASVRVLEARKEHAGCASAGGRAGSTPVPRLLR